MVKRVGNQFDPVVSRVVRKWSRTFSEFSEFRKSDKSLKHEFKDPVSHMCLAGTELW